MEEDEREGRSLVLVVEEDEVEGFPLEPRRVALWMSSRGVWDLDCLPNVRGNWALIPSYISASSSIFLCDLTTTTETGFDYTITYLLLLYRSFTTAPPWILSWAGPDLSDQLVSCLSKMGFF